MDLLVSVPLPPPRVGKKKGKKRKRKKEKKKKKRKKKRVRVVRENAGSCQTALTSPGFHQLVDLVPGVHGAQVEQLDDGPRLLQLGGVVGRRGELLEDLAAHAGGGLLLLDHGAVAEVALDEQAHLVVVHEDLVAAHVVEPALHERLDPDLVLLGAGAGRRQGRGHGGHEGLWVRGYEVLGELHKFGVEAAHISVLGGPKAR
ncbi:hypothetical protein VTK73DRAFT_2187 [Phialemonium thermophilum]|uniref:Uncharacterized protein n=1 Tax=Phialemonium thermophilum TaxID=223376 RepID=A0ABR3VSH7_9PEZI